MPTFKVDLHRLEWTITDLRTYMKDLDQELAEIDHHMAKLQHAWTGEAATAQAEAHHDWATGAKNMHHSVTLMHQAAVTAKGNYTGAAAKNITIWGN